MKYNGQQLNLRLLYQRHTRAKSENEIHTWQTFAAVLTAFHAARAWTADDRPQWPAVSLHTASLSPVSLV